MLKFFRKYNKLILVVGGSILMVVFLLPSTLTQTMSTFDTTPVAKIRGGTLTSRELRAASQEVQLVGSVYQLPATFLGLETRSPEHWLLLSTEAQRAGLVGGRRDGLSELPADRVEPLRSRVPMSDKEFDATLAKAKGSFRLIDLMNLSMVYSTREAVRFGQQTMDKATVAVVIVPAEGLSESMPEPTPEEIEAQFEQFKDIRALDNPDGVGYLRDQAVQLEWMRIDRSAVSNALQLEPIEVNKHWRQNRELFPKEFAEERANVEAAYRAMRTNAVLERVNDVVRRELFRSLAGLPSDGRFKTLPEDWKDRRPAFDTLAGMVSETLASEFQLNDLRPLRGPDLGRWFTTGDLTAIDGIGQSSTGGSAGGRGESFASVAMSVKELASPNAERLAAQAGVVLGPLSDPGGNQYYFRVNAARAESPPDSSAEVIDAVRRDVRIAAAMRQLEGEAEVFRERAIGSGINAVAGQANAAVQWTTLVTDQQALVSEGGIADPRLDTPAFREEVMKLARTLDPRADMAMVDPGERTLAMVLPSAQGAVVAQIQQWRPMTIDAFQKSAAQVHTQATGSTSLDTLFASFRSDAVKARLGFQALGEPAEDPEGGEGDAAAPAPSASEERVRSGGSSR